VAAQKLFAAAKAERKKLSNKKINGVRYDGKFAIGKYKIVTLRYFKLRLPDE